MLTHNRSIHLMLIAILLSVGLLVPHQEVLAADTEIAFIWRFSYHQNTGNGILDIEVVEHEVDSHDVVALLEQFTYAVPCSASGNSIICALDIQSAAKDAYFQMDLKEEAAKVRGGESYRWMVVETTGSWHTIPAKVHSAIASHPSLSTAIATNSTGKTVTYVSKWNSHTAVSSPFSPHLDESHTMVNKFDCPKVGPCVSENYLISGGNLTPLGSKQLSVSTVGFQLAPAQIVITPPTGFQLESFIIDPPKAGYG